MSVTITLNPGDTLQKFGVNSLNDKTISITSEKKLEEGEIIEALQTVANVRRCQADLVEVNRDINLSVYNHNPNDWTTLPEYAKFLNAVSGLRREEELWEEVKTKYKITKYEESFIPQRLIVGICGGTASGKTVLSEKIKMIFGDNAVLLEQDAYYKDLSGKTKEERAAVNFDHPDSIDFDQYEKDLKELREGRTITKPQYDFKEHLRKPVGVPVKPAQIIMPEGILVGAVEQIRKLCDILIFVDTPDDERYARRVQRDTEERGRTLIQVREQYFTTVKPMHDQFVAPSRQDAHLIVPGSARSATINESARRIADMIEATLARKQPEIVSGKKRSSSTPSSPLRRGIQGSRDVHYTSRKS